MAKVIKYLDVEAQQKRGRYYKLSYPAQFAMFSPNKRHSSELLQQCLGGSKSTVLAQILSLDSNNTGPIARPR